MGKELDAVRKTWTATYSRCVSHTLVQTSRINVSQYAIYPALLLMLVCSLLRAIYTASVPNEMFLRHYRRRSPISLARAMLCYIRPDVQGSSWRQSMTVRAMLPIPTSMPRDFERQSINLWLYVKLISLTHCSGNLFLIRLSPTFPPPLSAGLTYTHSLSTHGLFVS